ncbi:MAG: DUF47 domain-containing protein [Thermotogae bacterium]|nr:MAG: DUF47 domain-containing protein [Thermotogota bacterium]
MTRFIGKMFPKKSPVELLREHAQTTKKASEFILPTLEAFLSENTEVLSTISKRVDQLERNADDLKVQIRESYSKLKFVYFDRVDVLTILQQEDAVIDAIDDFAKYVMLNTLEKPLDEELANLLFQLAGEASRAIDVMFKSVEGLILVVESSFSPKSLQDEEKEALEVEDLEASTDKTSIEIGKRLFSMKNSIHPVDLFFLEKLVRLLARIADHAENVVERIRMITHS